MSELTKLTGNEKVMVEVYEQLCKLHTADVIIRHMLSEEQTSDNLDAAIGRQNIGEVLDLNTLKVLKEKLKKLVEIYMEKMHNHEEVGKLTKNGIIFNPEKNAFVNYKDLYEYCIIELKKNVIKLPDGFKSIRSDAISELVKKKKLTLEDVTKSQLEMEEKEDMKKKMRGVKLRRRIFNHRTVYQGYSYSKRDFPNNILSGPKLHRIIKKINEIEILPDQPFYELCKIMIYQIKYWNDNGFLGNVKERKKDGAKINQSLINYVSVVYTWFEFINCFDFEIVMNREHLDWFEYLSMKEDSDIKDLYSYFWWGIENSKKTNLRGLLFQMIKNVYAPFHLISYSLELKSPTLLHKKPIFKYPSVELAIYNSSKDFQRLIYVLVTLLVYQGDTYDVGFTKDYERVMKYFELNDQKIPRREIEIPKLYRPSTVSSYPTYFSESESGPENTLVYGKKFENLEKFEKSILTYKGWGGKQKGKHNLFRKNRGSVILDQEFSSNQLEYDIVDDCINRMYVNHGDFAFQHLVPLIAIVKYWRNIATMYTELPLTDAWQKYSTIINRNTMRPVIRKPLKIQIKSNENTLEDYLIFKILKESAPVVHKAIEFLQTKVRVLVESPFRASYYKIDHKQLQIFYKGFIVDRNQYLKPKETSILFRIINRFNYGKYMFPNPRNVINYTNKEGRVKRLCFEYEKENLVTRRKFVFTETWENFGNYGKFVKNITEFYSRFASKRMLLAQILIYYLDISSKDGETPTDISTNKTYKRMFLGNRENKYPVLLEGCPGIFGIGIEKNRKYVFGIVDKVKKGDDDKYRTYAIRYIKGNNIGFSLDDIEGGYHEEGGVEQASLDDSIKLEFAPNATILTPMEYYKIENIVYDEDLENSIFEFYDPLQFPLDDPFRYLFPSTKVVNLFDSEKKSVHLGRLLNLTHVNELLDSKEFKRIPFKEVKFGM